jgi:hypothetical protein
MTCDISLLINQSCIDDRINTLQFVLRDSCIVAGSPREKKNPQLTLPLHHHARRALPCAPRSEPAHPHLPFLAPKCDVRAADSLPLPQAVNNSMQRSAIRLLRPAAAAILRHPHKLTTRQFTLQPRKMSEIKKVFTENACPRKLWTCMRWSELC